MLTIAGGLVLGGIGLVAAFFVLAFVIGVYLPVGISSQRVERTANLLRWWKWNRHDLSR
jgi:hypothetical protein